MNIGLFCSTPMVALSRNVPRKHAMEMLLTGDMISAEEAMRIGLSTGSSIPTRSLRKPVAGPLIASKPAAHREDRQGSFYRQLEMGLREAYDYASRVMTENMLDAEAEEGIGAFVEKREPKWPNKHT